MFELQGSYEGEFLGDGYEARFTGVLNEETDMYQWNFDITPDLVTDTDFEFDWPTDDELMSKAMNVIWLQIAKGREYA